MIPPNAITRNIDQWKTLKDLDEEKSLYSRFVKLFHHLDEGHKYKEYELAAYNGGLFKKDAVLDSLIITDNILHTNTIKLSTYDYNTEVDVNILGHIFENSITEIEQVKAEIEGEQTDKNRSRRKKEGIFYTPKYITKYIVDNTVGALCKEKKKELGIDDIENEIIENSRTSKGKLSKKAEKLLKKLDDYRTYLLSLKILDPACGSGAFLNQALEYLINEHDLIDSYRRELEQDSLGLYDVTKSILGNNLYGVDINEEAVEIAKLSLWIRTAERGRKLSDLNNNLKCGNSLIDDPAVAGEKAFDWKKEFPQVFNTTSPSIPLLTKEREEKGEVENAIGGFDVVIGNPPYVKAERIKEFRDYFKTKFKCFVNNADLYVYFYEQALSILKNNGLLGFITSNKFIKADYGINIRALLSEQYIFQIIDFGELSVFSDAATFPSIVLIKKSSESKETKFLQVKSLHDIDLKLLLDTEMLLVPNSTLKQEKWLFISSIENDLINKILSKGHTINEVCKGRIRRGILTGFNEAFIIDSDKRNEIINQSNNSSELIKPFVSGDDVRKYFIDFKEKYLILTKIGVNISEYPVIFEHLSKSKSSLETRYDKGKYWWELRACDYYEDFKKPKIIYGQFQQDNYFTPYFDEIYFGSNHYMIVLDNWEETLFVSTILNSKIYFYFMSNLAGVLGDAKKGGRIIAQKSHFVNFVIPNAIDQERKRLILFADSMLVLNKQSQEKQKTFLSRIQSNFTSEKLSNKLKEFYNYDFKTFISELKKKKVTLTLKQHKTSGNNTLMSTKQK